MRSTKKLGLLLAVVVMIAAASCSSDSNTSSSDSTATTGATGADSVLGPIDEATGEPVKVGFITDGKNNVTDQTIEIDVANATVEYLNQHKGGIGGRPIELDICEAKTDPAVTTTCANQMVQDDVVAVAIGSVANVDAAWPPLHDAGIPAVIFGASSQEILTDTQSTFILSNPNGVVQVPIAVAQDTGKKKVTAVVIDVPAALGLFEGGGSQLFSDAGIQLDLVKVPPGTADMVPYLQPALTGGDPGVVHVLGNDSFCIAAFQAMQASAYTGPRTAITQCISDATRQALPGGELDGVVVGSASPVGANDDTDLLYRTVVETYGTNIDTSRAAGHAAFTVVAGLAAAVTGISGDITPATITATIKAMPEMPLPDGGGLTFQCNGQQVPGDPAVCVSGVLVTTLDAQGNATTYKASAG